MERKKRQVPRSRTYGVEVEAVVLKVWESLDYICAQRLKPSLLRTAQHLARFGEVSLTAELEGCVAKMDPVGERHLPQKRDVVIIGRKRRM